MFSHSKLELFKQCPRKYKFKYIEKIPVKINHEHLIKGSNVHKVLEFYGLKEFETVFNSMPEEVQNISLNFINSDLGRDVLSADSVRELKIIFDENFEPSDNSNEFFIGYIDRINKKQTLELIDFKTGKYKEPKYQSYDQLLTYSLYIFKKYPISEILLRFIYVEHLKENSILCKRESIDCHENYLKSMITTINKSTETDSFIKNQSRLCDWCEYKDLCAEESMKNNEIFLIP